MEKRIALGDSMACVTMASTYLCGHLGLPTDKAKAVELYQKASELGNSDAIYNLGNELAWELDER